MITPLYDPCFFFSYLFIYLFICYNIKMQRCCQEVSAALSSMSIEHKGDIVVSFDVLG